VSTTPNSNHHKFSSRKKIVEAITPQPEKIPEIEKNEANKRKAIMWKQK
jgi:hypothetical protein